MMTLIVLSFFLKKQLLQENFFLLSFLSNSQSTCLDRLLGAVIKNIRVSLFKLYYTIYDN